jgi:hypothetical protein
MVLALLLFDDAIGDGSRRPIARKPGPFRSISAGDEWCASVTFGVGKIGMPRKIWSASVG